MIRSQLARRALLVITLLSGAMARETAAQLPGLPVLQNAFAGPGFAAAINGGGATGSSAYAAALGWAPGSARFQLSIGAGGFRTGGGTGGAFGARIAVPILTRMNGNLGFAAFGGVGGAQGPKLANAQRIGYGQAPLGASVGYRRVMGATRAISFYGTPFVAFYRNDFGNTATSTTMFRVSIGADVALTRALGITAGLETGQNRGAKAVGPSGGVWGVGVSYAFGRR